VKLNPTLGSNLVRAVVLAVVGVIVVAAVITLWPGDDQKRLTAEFPRTVSIYEGSTVRILGVPVGEVVTVEPAGTTVKVAMTYDPEVDLPKDVKAAVVAPSVVGDRFIQLTPVHTKGPVLEDGAVLGTDRTAIPLELDQIYAYIDDLAVGLGPRGANKNGALSDLLATTADNFGGQGAKFNETIRNLSRFTSTLDNNKDALFDTAEEIDRFVSALARNDQTVRDFNDSLAAASGLLEDERDDLAAALRNLGVAMEQVSTFVRDNKESLSRNIKGLARLSDTLAKRRGAVDEILSAAPVALANLYHTYNNNTGTLDTRANLGDVVTQLEQDPATYFCTLTGTVDQNGQVCDAFKQIFPTNRRAAPGAAVDGRSKGGSPLVLEPIDKSLAGLLEVER
jgi:phospholipid/cholesterol/gamma-HCH transport system substrate-binding protein